MNQIRTFTGRLVNPFDLKSNDINLLDIAHVLSRKGRWNDHTEFHYSVASHSIQVAQRIKYFKPQECTRELYLAALLHDASETYFADIASPTKKNLPDIKELEVKIQNAIENKFNLPAGILNDPLIKASDHIAIFIEGATLVTNFEFDDTNPLSTELFEANYIADMAKYLAKIHNPNFYTKESFSHDCFEVIRQDFLHEILSVL